MTPPPTQTGFTAFVRGAGVTTSVLPDDSGFLTMAYAVALEIASQDINSVSPLMYTLAVYNLGMSNLVNFAQDTPPSTYFSNLRKSLLVGSFVAGVITSTSDEGTSESLVTPEFMRSLTLQNLRLLKDPWGRQYLEIAQGMGSLWGVS